MSSRNTCAPTVQRRSRAADSRISQIPKPRRPGSYDRVTEAGWRGGRPRSLEPPRAGAPVGRPSERVPSAQKLPPGQRRSRSAQQSDGWPQMTPINKNKHSYRATATPMRTPSADRSARSWQSCLERALAFVVVKDRRPISDAKWQRTTAVRLNEELERLGGNSGVQLVKPLTINRFVEITASLLAALDKAKLDSTNYVTKLPHIMKRLLYPGNVSKSWLKTVNTLHTYPMALALIGHLLDLNLRIEEPVDEEIIFVDEKSRLRWEHIANSWYVFNQKKPDYTNVDNDYLDNLRGMLGDYETRRAALCTAIEDYRQVLSDPSEAAARAEETRRDELLQRTVEEVRDHRSARITVSGQIDAAAHKQKALLDENAKMHAENERLQAELEQLKAEVSNQPLTTAARAHLLDQVDYSNRVIDSKNELVQQVSKMLQKAESDLALSQKQCLAVCNEYNQRIISLTSVNPDAAKLAVEERDLMKDDTVSEVGRAVETLRSEHSAREHAARDAERARAQALRRLSERNYSLGQTNARIQELTDQVEQLKLQLRTAREELTADREQNARKLAEQSARAEKFNKMAAELLASTREQDELKAKDKLWEERVQDVSRVLAEQRLAAPLKLQQCKKVREDIIKKELQSWNLQLDNIHMRYKI